MNHKTFNSIIKLAVLVTVIFIFIYIAIRSDVDVSNEVVDALPVSTVDTDNYNYGYTELRYEIPETTYTPISTTDDVETSICYDDTFYDINYEDSQLLVRLAMAEAGNQDIQGKALVMMVVLNRVQDSQFPDTINDVIMQENQFTPVSNGMFYEVKPSDECYDALDLIVSQGWDESQGALYFEGCSNADNWHSRNLEYLFIHGDHRFYK